MRKQEEKIITLARIRTCILTGTADHPGELRYVALGPTKWRDCDDVHALHGVVFGVDFRRLQNPDMACILKLDLMRASRSAYQEPDWRIGKRVAKELAAAAELL